MAWEESRVAEQARRRIQSSWLRGQGCRTSTFVSSNGWRIAQSSSSLCQRCVCLGQTRGPLRPRWLLLLLPLPSSHTSGRCSSSTIKFPRTCRCNISRADWECWITFGTVVCVDIYAKRRQSQDGRSWGISTLPPDGQEMAVPHTQIVRIKHCHQRRRQRWSGCAVERCGEWNAGWNG